MLARSSLLLAALSLACCVRHQAFRWERPRSAPPPREAVLDGARECAGVLPGQADDASAERCSDGDGELFRLAYAEIDDQGRAWSPAQIDHSMAFLDAAHDRGALVVVFVHGWRHDASPDDANVSDFRRVLFAVAQAERRSGTGRAVRGLYLGWRAHPFRTTPVTTFWARKKGAHRVGERDGGRVLDELGHRLERWRAVERKELGADRTRALIVGHSFGAAVVHSAVHRQLERDLVRRRASGEPGSALAYDLVALVNPAFEAARFRSLHELGTASGVSGAPVLLLVTTKADCNTSKHFRMGMNGIRGEGVFRDDGQKMQRNTGAGHFPWAGRVVADAIACEKAPTGDPVLGPAQVHFIGDMQSGSDAAAPEKAATADVGKRRRSDLCPYTVHDHEVACRLAGTPPAAPVLVVYDTESELMDHHSDVFNPALWSFLWSIADDATAPPVSP